MRRGFVWTVLLACGSLLAGRAGAQATYAAYGPGSYVSVGAEFAGFESDYGKRLLEGPTVYVDAHLYRLVGVEAEGRDLNLHTDEGIKERTYLIGPKLSWTGRRLRPYVKFLVGRGEFDYPFGYATGSYFVTAPGGGVDYRVGQSRFILRGDFEYQIWPNFTYGAIKPYGASVGISFVVFNGWRKYQRLR